MLKSILKGSSFIFAIKIVSAISNMLVGIVISRSFGVESLGTYNLVFTLVTFLSILSKMGLDLYVVRKIAEYEDDEIKTLGFLKQAFVILGINSGVVCVLVLLMSGLLNEHIFPDIDAFHYIVGLSLFAGLYAITIVFSFIFRGFHELFRFAVIRNVLLQFGLLLLLAVSVYILKIDIDPVYALFASITIGLLTSIVLLYFFLRKKYGPGFVGKFSRSRYTASIVKYSYPMMIGSSSIFIMGKLNTLFVSYFHGIYEVGLYAAIIRLSLPLSFLNTSINGYLAPKIAKNYVNGNLDVVKRLYYNTIKILLAAGIPIGLSIYLFPEFFLGLFGEEHKQTVIPLYIYTAAIFVGGSLFGPIASFLSLTDNQHIYQRIIILALIVNIVLNLILVPEYGITGAAIAVLVSTFLWKFIGFIVLKKYKIV